MLFFLHEEILKIEVFCRKIWSPLSGNWKYSTDLGFCMTWGCGAAESLIQSARYQESHSQVSLTHSCCICLGPTVTRIRLLKEDATEDPLVECKWDRAVSLPRAESCLSSFHFQCLLCILTLRGQWPAKWIWFWHLVFIAIFQRCIFFLTGMGDLCSRLAHWGCHWGDIFC